MKASVLASSLVALCLTASSAQAQQDVYDNGPTDGESLGYTINFGFSVSDQFTLPQATVVNGLTFAAWLFPGDVLETAEVTITSSEFGGTVYLDQTVSFVASGCFGNASGFNVCNETGSFLPLDLNTGSYWLNLQNAVVNTGDLLFWDVNNGPSQASENSLGSIPSESFTMLGGETTTVSTTTVGTSPEPDTVMLFGSGILVLAGVLRRKLF